jgi:hypothetical protein
LEPELSTDKAPVESEFDCALLLKGKKQNVNINTIKYNFRKTIPEKFKRQK